MVDCTGYFSYLVIPPKGILVVIFIHARPFAIITIDIDFDAVIVPFIVASTRIVRQSIICHLD